LENPGKRGRPRGFDKEKYWRVLYALLDGPKCFNEIVTRSGLSRRFVWKVLKHALMRDFVGVNYSGHKALYFLKCEEIVQPPTEIVIDGLRHEARIIEEPPSLFHKWWSLGLPPHDEFNELDDRVAMMEGSMKASIASFLYTRYPHLKVSDPDLWANDDGLPSKLAGEDNVTFKKLFEVVMFDVLRRKKRILEDVVLDRVVNALNDRMLCPLCFRRGRLNLLERMEGGFYRCRDRRCGASFKHPWKNSRVYNEFSEWWERRDVIKLGRIKVLL